ncbi:MULTISPECIES: alpha-ketoglutaric semialdehyde dehydrogenase GucD [unclassified Paenibacillus]|uniref:alpha-ketoglutaric semialdehyde dehydrogenase GucD n=1 Tax=unclassified Paenibacillus TaxID=185978 RepID=UPI000CFACBFF|nr:MULTISPECIES: alpha-ketoglutaric semialdehyde dehydrogenase GucD [unclassified Paenibacillus]MBD8837119.1 aldehyde dehydrogenase family protein [Paenibacillus sp. CFBP 13594]PRA07635.1 aldehyde dehydrogenase family protein [Paenibacillus sp. MYb63]PRA51280.1 aldehyde dehydrogenase family protein [Paenibacillus sp. MYb67]
MTTFQVEQTYSNYINGEWVKATSGETEPSINPANRKEVVGYVPTSGIEDLNRAVAAAKEAAKDWRRLSGAERGNYLFQAANVLERRADEVAEAMTREMGKTLPEAKGETLRGVAILRYYAGEGMRKTGDVIPSTDSEALMFTTRVPLGVVGVIAPWNFPVAIPIWKTAPALIYGNTVVLKPAQETAVTAAKVMECFEEAGIPAGVLNLICGRGSVIGSALAEHPDVGGITFTGSNEVGKRVGAAALARGAKYQLEMGGKNPIIIAADADLDLAVEATISGGLKSTGQKCTATSKVIIERKVYDAFKEKLLSQIQEIRLGDGMSSGSWMGPCASEGQLNTVLSYIQKGQDEGAVLLAGGKRGDGPGLEEGFYVQPTVFEGVESHMSIAREEIFGPVLALIAVDSLEEAIEAANDSDYGLSASIYTQNVGAMLSFIRDMDAGLVRINAETAGVELQAPFGGMKMSSSHSREQGQAAIEFFTAIKTVFVKS